MLTNQCIRKIECNRECLVTKIYFSKMRGYEGWRARKWITVGKVDYPKLNDETVEIFAKTKICEKLNLL